MDTVSFIFGFTDELEKRAGKGSIRKAVKGAVGKASKAGLKGAGKAGWGLAGAAAPYMLVGGVPLYFGAKAVSEGFGRGVSEEANKRLPYER